MACLNNVKYAPIRNDVIDIYLLAQKYVHGIIFELSVIVLIDLFFSFF